MRLEAIPNNKKKTQGHKSDPFLKFSQENIGCNGGVCSAFEKMIEVGKEIQRWNNLQAQNFVNCNICCNIY